MPREPFGTAYGEDSLDVVPPLGVAVERLRGVVADAADAVAVDFGAERAGDPLGQVLRLIVAAAQPFAPVERHGDDPVHRVVEAAVGQAVTVPYAHIACKAPCAVVFEAVDQFAPPAAGDEVEEGRSLFDGNQRREPLPQGIVSRVAEARERHGIAAAGADHAAAGRHLAAADRTPRRKEQPSDAAHRITEDRHRS